MNLLNFSFIRNDDNYGYVEYISHGEVSGWAYSKSSDIQFIGIFLGNQLVTLSPLNISRNDIKDKFKIDYPTGFRILFDYKMGRKSVNVLPKICALNSNKEIIFKLKLISSLRNKNIKDIFYSPYFGCDGRFDGINLEGTISGWASKRNYKGKLKIWLQSDKKVEPMEIICDIWRKDLYYFKVEDCGFEINPNQIPPNFYDSNIWLTFDKEGKHNIDPTGKRINFEINNGQYIGELNQQDNNMDLDLYQKQVDVLNKFKILLDKVEENK